jgi:hypothetical protein
MQLTDMDVRAVFERTLGDQPQGHSHFWQRAALSRRQFIGGTVAAAGTALGAALVTPVTALGDATTTASPKPIPTGDLPPFRFRFPGPTSEPSTIFDFDGFSGIAVIGGVGTGSDGGDHFDVDMRFMDGVFIGDDGRTHQGTFGFV